MPWARGAVADRAAPPPLARLSAVARALQRVITREGAVHEPVRPAGERAGSRGAGSVQRAASSGPAGRGRGVVVVVGWGGGVGGARVELGHLACEMGDTRGAQRGAARGRGRLDQRPAYAESGGGAGAGERGQRGSARVRWCGCE